MSDCISIYITTPDEPTARRIAEALLNAEVIACANILPQMQSLYRWKGKVERESEAVLIVKTQHAHLKAIKALVREQHPDEVPCLVVWPIIEGDADYLRWIAAETPLARNTVT